MLVSSEVYLGSPSRLMLKSAVSLSAKQFRNLLRVSLINHIGGLPGVTMLVNLRVRLAISADHVEKMLVYCAGQIECLLAISWLIRFEVIWDLCAGHNDFLPGIHGLIMPGVCWGLLCWSG